MSKLDIILKIIAPLITVTGMVIGVWQFQTQQAFNQTQDFRRKVWDKKLEAYNMLSEITSQVMAGEKDKNFDTLRKKYKRIHWLTMPFFEDRVEMYLSDFDEEINSVARGEGGKGVLRTRGYRLLKACKASLDSSYLSVNKERWHFFK